MRIITWFMINLVCIFTNNSAQQNENEQIIAMLKKFYITYNSVWENAASYTPKEFEKIVFSLQQEYCTDKLQEEIKKYYDIYKLEHDLLTNDFGGTNSEKLKSTLVVVKDTTNENSYIVSYMVEIKASSTPHDEKNIIHITVIKENDKYKINKVW